MGHDLQELRTQKRPKGYSTCTRALSSASMAVICHMFSDGAVCPVRILGSVVATTPRAPRGSILVFGITGGEDGGEVEPALHPQHENSLLHSRC